MQPRKQHRKGYGVRTGKRICSFHCVIIITRGKRAGVLMSCACWQLEFSDGKLGRAESVVVARYLTVATFDATSKAAHAQVSETRREKHLLSTSIIITGKYELVFAFVAYNKRSQRWAQERSQEQLPDTQRRYMTQLEKQACVRTRSLTRRSILPPPRDTHIII